MRVQTNGKFTVMAEIKTSENGWDLVDSIKDINTLALAFDQAKAYGAAVPGTFKQAIFTVSTT